MTTIIALKDIPIKLIRTHQTAICPASNTFNTRPHKSGFNSLSAHTRRVVNSDICNFTRLDCKINGYVPTSLYYLLAGRIHAGAASVYGVSIKSLLTDVVGRQPWTRVYGELDESAFFY